MTKLYDVLEAYVPSVSYKGNILVFEATAEPARSSARVVERWVPVAEHLTVVAVKGMHMKILTHPEGLSIAHELCARMRELSHSPKT